MKNYELYIRIPIRASDDPEARSHAEPWAHAIGKIINNKTGLVVKLREVREASPPRPVQIGG